MDSTYSPVTVVPSGQTRARLGRPSKEQLGSPGPPLLEPLLPLLELLLTGSPLLEPLDPLLLLDPLGEPPLEPDAPLLDPPVLGGGAPSPTFGSTRPMQPRSGRPAKITGAT